MTHKYELALHTQTGVNHLNRAVLIGPLLDLSQFSAVGEHELTAYSG